MSKIFETRMEVRDYECDIEGIVNNANYLHYMEHTRHLFLKACGLSFAEMHAKGTDAVVHRIDIQYKSLCAVMMNSFQGSILRRVRCAIRSSRTSCGSAT